MTGAKEFFDEMRQLEISEIKSFPVSKQEIQAKANEALTTILETGISLEMAQAFSAVEKFIDAIKKDPLFLESVIAEANKDGGKVTLKSGTRIELAETGVKYDYSHDEEWDKLEQLIKPLREQQKQREDFLKKIPPGKQLIEDGVIIGTGPAKTSTSSFKVFLK